MKVNVRAFGVAKDILNSSKMEIESEGTIAELKNDLVASYPEFSKLASLRFAVNEEYQADDYQLNEGDEVVIIPPVSGG